MRAPSSRLNKITEHVVFQLFLEYVNLSTVRDPHDPAFTVESLAITHAVRPCILPAAVTTPSAGKPVCSQLANNASSTYSPLSNRTR